MDAGFDPYHRWLGIPPDEQPPNYYRLLGIGLFESDVDVINNAAERQMVHLRRFQTGPHAALCQRLLNEVAAARICLTDPKRKSAYDEQLKHEMTAVVCPAGELPVGVLRPPPVASPVPPPVAPDSEMEDDVEAVPTVPSPPLSAGRVPRPLARRRRDIWRSPAVSIILLMLVVFLGIVVWLVLSGEIAGVVGS
ncbi:hypothetical protein JCM19992_16880 [Thermostilla marina]